MTAEQEMNLAYILANSQEFTNGNKEKAFEFLRSRGYNPQRFPIEKDGTIACNPSRAIPSLFFPPTFAVLRSMDTWKLNALFLYLGDEIVLSYFGANLIPA